MLDHRKLESTTCWSDGSLSRIFSNRTNCWLEWILWNSFITVLPAHVIEFETTMNRMLTVLGIYIRWQRMRNCLYSPFFPFHRTICGTALFLMEYHHLCETSAGKLGKSGMNVLLSVWMGGATTILLSVRCISLLFNGLPKTFCLTYEIVSYHKVIKPFVDFALQSFSTWLV